MAEKRQMGSWFGRVFGNVRGSLDRVDYLWGMLLLWLVIMGVGALLAGRPELWRTLHAGTADAIPKLVFPELLIPVRLCWIFLDTKRLRALGLPIVLALVVHGIFIVDQLVPDLALPGLMGLIFMGYIACLVLLPSRTRIVGHSRTGRKLTILGMQEKE